MQYSLAESHIIEAAVATVVKDKLRTLIVPVKTRVDVAAPPRRYYACVVRDNAHISITQARMEILLDHGTVQRIQSVHEVRIFSRPIMVPDRLGQVYQNIRFVTHCIQSQDIMGVLWKTYFQECETLADEVCLSEQGLSASALTLSFTTFAPSPAVNLLPIPLKPARIETIRTVAARVLNTLRDAPPVLPSVIRRMLNVPLPDARTPVRPTDLAFIVPACTDNPVCAAFVGVGDRTLKAVYLDVTAAPVMELRLVATGDINAIAQGWEIRTDEPLTDEELRRVTLDSMHKFHRATLNRILHIPRLLPIALAVSRKRWGETGAPPAISRLNGECMARIVHCVIAETQ